MLNASLFFIYIFLGVTESIVQLNTIDAQAEQLEQAAANQEMQERLIAKLQESTTKLMEAQTELNSVENIVQQYKTQYKEWMQNLQPIFEVKGDIDHTRGYVVSSQSDAVSKCSCNYR